MKVFVVSLARDKKRRKFITQQCHDLALDHVMVDAVDGRLLTKEEIALYCDQEKVKELSWWLTPGAIGCALSHRKVYQEIVEQDLPYAMVIEDDIILPDTIKQIMKDAEGMIQRDGVIMLYYQSHRSLKVAAEPVLKRGATTLVYPIDPNAPITTAAYIIDREAAKKLYDQIVPVRVAADSWGYFFEQGYIRTLQCLYPPQLKVANFKSSIDYIKSTSMLGKFLAWVDKYSIPPIYQILAYRRARRLQAMTARLEFTHESSPLIPNESQP
jgi:glycosyl transferase family 25